jgi:hypothetical protein
MCVNKNHKLFIKLENYKDIEKFKHKVFHPKNRGGAVEGGKAFGVGWEY